MTVTAKRESVIERLRRDGRLPQAINMLLGCGLVNPDKTTAIRCVNIDHEDRHASAVVEPNNGRVTCRGCGRTWGLLELGVLRAFGKDEAAVARRLEHFYYPSAGGRRGSAASGPAAARTGAETPSRRRNPPSPRLEPGVSVPSPPEGVLGKGRTERTQGEFPFVPDDVVESLGWKVFVESGRKVLKAPIYDAKLEVCGVKVRGPRRADGKHHAFLEPCRSGRKDSGLLHAEGLADLGPGMLVLVLAGETDLLAFVEAARREGVHAVVVSPSNGERQSLRALAAAFRGLRVVFMYDADDAGRTGALDAVWDLRDQAEKAAALALPFADEQIAAGMKDVRDFLTAGGTAARLVELAKGALEGKGVVVEEKKAASPTKNGTPAAPALPWTPFPVDALPPVLANLVTEGAAAIGGDASFIALPTLSVVASAIGNTRTALLKKGWTEPCVVWTAIVGESGTHKSPCLDVALDPLRAEDDEAQAEHAEDVRVWRSEKPRHEAAFGEWKRSGGEGEPPVEPEFPKARRHVVVDATVEAIAKLLNENPRGLLLARDELSGWLRSFDAYRAGKGGDAAFYLLAHGARQHTVDRKGTDTPTIHVPRAALSLTGGIQPGTLAASIGKEHTDDGLLARLLFALPPRTTSKWTTAVVDDLTRAAYAKVVRDLLAIPLVTDEHGMPRPVALPLTKEGQDAWVSFYDRFAERQAAAVGEDAAALAKLVSYAARFALVHQLVRDAAAAEIDAQAVLSGARLCEWFADETIRVYGILVESPEDTQRRRLVEWVEARGGRTTVRDLSRGPRQYRDAQVAEEALDALVASGLGTWEEKETGEKGGRPTRAFVLKKSTVETVTDEPAAPTPPDTSSRGDGTETSHSSLGDGGFRRHEGVLAPPEGSSAAAAPIDLGEFEDDGSVTAADVEMLAVSGAGGRS